MPTNLLATANAKLRGFRAHPAFNRIAREELKVDRGDRHPVDPEHRPHLLAAIDWLLRAQDATGTGGVARGYSLGWNPYFRSRGWQAAYPETTGYIIPTLLGAASYLGRPELIDRAKRAGDWEIDVQLESGAVQGGVIGQPRSPAVFNTGQVILGWVALFEETGDRRYADAARRASEYLVSVLGPSNLWGEGNSKFARKDSTLYNARVAWGLAEAGRALDRHEFLDAAGRNLRAVRDRQLENGWFPDCCLTDPSKPLLHTLAYTIRGLIEGGRVLGDQSLVTAGARASRALAGVVRSDGWLSGRFDSAWNGAVGWSCLTGDLQMCNNWIRLYHITGEAGWTEPVARVLGFVKSTQNRESSDPGLRGGIKGSWPVDGDYGKFELLNWATKYFVDALIRDDRVAQKAGPDRSVHRLA